MRSWRIILVTCALLWGGVDAFSSRAPLALGQSYAGWQPARGVTNRAGLATGYGYDALSRLTLVTNALAKVTSFQFDIAGNETNQIRNATRKKTDSTNQTMGDPFPADVASAPCSREERPLSGWRTRPRIHWQGYLRC